MKEWGIDLRDKIEEREYRWRWAQGMKSERELGFLSRVPLVGPSHFTTKDKKKKIIIIIINK